MNAGFMIPVVALSFAAGASMVAALLKSYEWWAITAACLVVLSAIGIGIGNSL